RRNPDATARVGADVERPKPGGGGGGRAGGGAAGRIARVPRVARDPMQRAVAWGLPAELGRGGLADDHRARRLEADDDGRVLTRRGLVGGPAPSPRRQPRLVDKVLDRAGYAIQQADRAAGAPTLRALPRRFERARVEQGECVDAGVLPSD